MSEIENLAAENSAPPEERTYRKRNARDIFAVDRRAWSKACDFGLNAAVAYLMLARGSGGDQRTVGWSVHALERRTGISRPNAKKAIETIKQAGLIQQVAAGTKPRYYIVPAHEIPGAAFSNNTLDATERAVWEYLRASTDASGSTWLTNRAHKQFHHRNPRPIASRLVSKGWAKALGNNTYEPLIPEINGSGEPDWIWLPNSILDGAGDEIPPVELIRQSQNLAALRLFIDLYKAQDLRAIGGVAWRPGSVGIRGKYIRHRVGERGPYVIWGFEAGDTSADVGPLVEPHFTGVFETRTIGDRTYHADTGWKVFWDAFDQLSQFGLLSMVPHLVESLDEGEVIFSQGHNGTSEESKLAAATLDAAESLLEDWQLSKSEAENQGLLVPVLRHMVNVQLVGVARLRYRTQTEATAEWYKRMSGRCAEWTQRYRRIEAVARGVALGVQHQGSDQG